MIFSRDGRAKGRGRRIDRRYPLQAEPITFFGSFSGRRGILASREDRDRVDFLGSVAMPAKETTLARVMQGLMERYRHRVPDVQRVVDGMIGRGMIGGWEDLENDHIAFRTMGSSPLGIASLEQIFLHLGYQRRDFYSFEGKKLDAFWYAPPTPKYPRIFISQLRVADLSNEAQAIIRSYLQGIERDPVADIDLDDWQAIDRFLHQPLWRLPSWSDYQRLASESEYAAWVLYNRYYLNHFTISVHFLPPPWNRIERYNEFLESIGVVLNDAGGKIKISEDRLLLQSSTVAQTIEAPFTEDGREMVHTIPGSYVEFAERKVLPVFEHLGEREAGREHRRDGFETTNADKIFESTFSAQVARGNQGDSRGHGVDR
jgi:hypothetical protein